MAKKYNPMLKMGFETKSVLTVNGNTPDANGNVNVSGGGGGVIEVTYAQAIAAMEAGTLTPGSMYKITDRGDRGLFFNAISTTRFAATGTRLMLCPADYAVELDEYDNNWIGVWHSTKTALINDLAIWGGHVWKNLTGDIGSSTDDVTLDSTNWVLISKTSFTNHEYVELVFGVEFEWENDWICKQWDNKGNVFGLDYISTLFYEYQHNYCDYSDWNDPDILNNIALFGIFNNMRTYIRNNICKCIANNADLSNEEKLNIYDNRTYGFIFNNSSIYPGQISGNKCYVDYCDISNNSNFVCIQNNKVNRISENIDVYHITGNLIDSYIDSNLRVQLITSNNIKGQIAENTDVYQITFNFISGAISQNHDINKIDYNLNNGPIQLNSSSGSFSIIRNINNGYIINNVLTSDITDTIVNKP